MSPIEITRVPEGEKSSGRHIVILKDTVSKFEHITHIANTLAGESTITNGDWTILHGYAGVFDDAALEALRASPDVKAIEEDGFCGSSDVVTQNNAPWGLQRITQNGRIGGSPDGLGFAYRFNSPAGAGVDIYIVDTGINITHGDFGGRARLGAVFGTTQNVDRLGHGTHVAGTAAGKQFGVAKDANLIAVKVLGDDGRGANSDFISGMNWVAQSASWTNRPSVVNMSINTDNPSQAVDDAATALTQRGIHVAVSAGNANKDALLSSPSRSRAVVTVGSSTINDERRFDSNFGSAVDIFAPGDNVISAGIASNTAWMTMSGTSMASPHVAGLIAYFIGRYGNTDTVTMSQYLQKIGEKNALRGLPAGTVNILARNDIRG
ncbi:serine protease [Amylostereum chailletii]|nr:serine protease [Amylostereum chailletii]